MEEGTKCKNLKHKYLEGIHEIVLKHSQFYIKNDTSNDYLFKISIYMILCIAKEFIFDGLSDWLKRNASFCMLY